MRFRSFLAVLVLAIAGLGFTGCGSTSTSSEFVATSNDVFMANSGELVFNFITAQAPFPVDANTANIQFDFYNGVDAAPIFSTFRAFDTTITIGGVPTDARNVIITGFDANGFPLFTINQTITVVGGATTVVEGINAPVAVTLTTLRLAPGNLFQLDQQLTQVDVPLNGTTQVFLFAEYSNGSIVLVGSQATYTSGAPAVATVSTLATVTGVAVGNTTLLVQFGGQTLNVPIIVTDGVNQALSAISVTNAQPISVAVGTPVQISVSGTRASDGQQFGLAPTDVTYASDSAVFVVDANGMVSTATGVTGNTGIITVTFTNPDTSTVTATASVVVP
jgi:hypothetical protein